MNREVIYIALITFFYLLSVWYKEDLKKIYAILSAIFFLLCYFFYTYILTRK